MSFLYCFSTCYSYSNVLYVTMCVILYSYSMFYMLLCVFNCIVTLMFYITRDAGVVYPWYHGVQPWVVGDGARPHGEGRRSVPGRRGAVSGGLWGDLRTRRAPGVRQRRCRCDTCLSPASNTSHIFITFTQSGWMCRQNITQGYSLVIL